MKKFKIIVEEDGATAIEYALLVGLIGVFCIGAWSYLGGEIADLYGESGGQVETSFNESIQGSSFKRKSN
jgi:pilus assembly protein Flp/PilA